MLSLGYDINQVFFLLFERESAPLAGKPRDDNGSLGRRAFPQFQYFELNSMSAGASETYPIQRWNTDT